MFGVVLWSDNTDRKAVIWCEDHGDLAYFDGSVQPEIEEPALDAGDFVQFDLQEGRRQRLASNPRVVTHGSHAGLPDALRNEAKGHAPRPRAAEAFISAEIISIVGLFRDRDATLEECVAV